jgi:hypothetical protein
MATALFLFDTLVNPSTLAFLGRSGKNQGHCPNMQPAHSYLPITIPMLPASEGKKRVHLDLISRIQETLHPVLNTSTDKEEEEKVNGIDLLTNGQKKQGALLLPTKA